MYTIKYSTVYIETKAALQAVGWQIAGHPELDDSTPNDNNIACRICGYK